MITTTQVEYPWRATVRTVIQALLGLAAILPLLIKSIGLSESLPIVGGVLAVAAIITRIMANPLVNSWLAMIGLSAAPRAVTHDPRD
jgi:hypothetical protein